MFHLYINTGILTILLVNLPWIACQSDDEICTEELDNLAESVSNFTRCAVNQASPFRFCRLCYQEFDTVREVKSVIYDKHYDCVKQLVESERYQIVKRVYDFATHLWEGSYCYNCFSSDNKNEINIGNPWVMKDDVVDFFDKQDIVNHCFKNFTQRPGQPLSNSTTNITMTNITNTHIVCTKCATYYNDLNSAYNDVIANIGSGGYIQENILCADVVSA
ncbi:hypothetical protein QZH41_008797, partial [Actinostola sp. cb2023]